MASVSTLLVGLLALTPISLLGEDWGSAAEPVSTEADEPSAGGIPAGAALPRARPAPVTEFDLPEKVDVVERRARPGSGGDGDEGDEAGPCGGLRAVDEPASQESVRIAAINTDGGESRLSRVHGAGAQRQQRHMRSLARLVDCLAADVVILSEVHRRTAHWPDTDMLGGLQERLPGRWRKTFERHCRGPRAAQGSAWVGMGILTTDTRSSGTYRSGFVDLPRGGRSLGIPLPVELREDLGSRTDYPGGWKNNSNPCFWSPDRSVRRRGQQRAAVVAATHGIEVVGVHLTPGAGNADIRRKQVRRLHDQLQVARRRFEDVTGRPSMPAVVAGDFNEGNCIFAGCGGERAFTDRFGDEWINATAPIRHTLHGRKLDNVFLQGGRLVPASNGATAHVLQTELLSHDVVYVDVADEPAQQ